MAERQCKEPTNSEVKHQWCTPTSVYEHGRTPRTCAEGGGQERRQQVGMLVLLSAHTIFSQKYVDPNASRPPILREENLKKKYLGDEIFLILAVRLVDGAVIVVARAVVSNIITERVHTSQTGAPERHAAQQPVR